VARGENGAIINNNDADHGHILHDSDTVSQPNPALNVLHFTLPGLRLFIRLEDVLRVLPMMALTPVPQGPAYLKGLMNIAGRSFPVIDLAERIGRPERFQYTIDTPILLCSAADRTGGLIVEEVIGVEEVQQGDVQMQPLFDPSDTPVLGVVNTGSGLSLSLDLERVLGFDLREPVIERRSSDRPKTAIKEIPGNG